MDDDASSDGSLAITICAVISIGFASWLILLFIFDSKWREDYRRIKRLTIIYIYKYITINVFCVLYI